VVDTLIRSSFETSEPNTRVLVRTRSLDREWLEIVVEDQSTRIPEEERRRIFRPFGQLDVEPEGRAGDLGLALPLVKRFVMAHGGLLHFGHGDPQGVAITILLPRHGPVMSGAADPDTGTGPGDGPQLRLAS